MEGLVVDVDKSPARIAGMFDAIAARYDLLNHLLSLGVDRYWRWRAVRTLALTGRETVVDVCTGTADLALALARPGRAARVVGIDFAGAMLRRGLEKIRRSGGVAPTGLARGDAMRLPLPDGIADGLTIAFGIRNVQDPAAACVDCRRVLRPGGRLAILEFGTPSLPVFRQVYGWYFTNVLPLIGRALSHHSDAYTYLPASVGLWKDASEFCDTLRGAGFTEVRAVRLTFGIVYLYVACKPDRVAAGRPGL
jgi:demethylmenaquinone methyltransferase/2-methoxy-6-polyprenyl-1,4-benzoquinol methylase